MTDDSEVARYLASYLAENVLRFGGIERSYIGEIEPFLNVEELTKTIKEFYDKLP